jgi:hypothetical protein
MLFQIGSVNQWDGTRGIVRRNVRKDERGEDDDPDKRTPVGAFPDSPEDACRNAIFSSRGTNEGIEHCWPILRALQVSGT